MENPPSELPASIFQALEFFITKFIEYLVTSSFMRLLRSLLFITEALGKCLNSVILKYFLASEDSEKFESGASDETLPRSPDILVTKRPTDSTFLFTPASHAFSLLVIPWRSLTRGYVFVE